MTPEQLEAHRVRFEELWLKNTGVETQKDEKGYYYDDQQAAWFAYQWGIADADRAQRAELADLRAAAPVVPAPGARDEWRELFWSVARALNCLPSTYVDGNAHVYKQAEKYAAIATAAPVAQLSEPPEGWVLVPIAPTIEMCEAGREAELFAPSARSSLVVYRAMLAAAPTTPKGTA